MFMVLLAGFAALVERYSGQQDVVIGAPVSNRHDENLKFLIGLFVNTIPMRVQVEGCRSFRDLLKSVRKTVLEAYDHQRVPFDRLVEELSPPRNLNRSPIFQVTFSYQPAFPTLNLGEALNIEPVLYDEYRARYDLELLAFANEEAVSLWWVFNRNLFNRARIEQMANHYFTLLDGISRSPDAPLESVEILSAEERTELLTVRNRTERALLTEKCVHELVEQQVSRTPEAIAATFDGERLTYSELNAAADRIARALQELKVGPETTVAICVPRSLWLAIAMLGVLKSGGVYVPLDPDYPDERLLYVLNDANANIVVTIDALQARFCDCDATIVSVDQLTSDKRSENPIKLRRDVRLQNLAYIIYTSGSTGHPKGVMVSHRSLLNHMLWMIQELPTGTPERFLQKSAFTFDASVWEFLVPWMVGEQVVLAPANILEVTKIIQAEQITRLQFTASALRAALEEDFSACTSLQTVFCGGEMVPPELVPSFFAKSKAKFHNLYGPTETTIISTKCDILTAAPQSAVPIGLPISNTQVYVMDQSLRITPAGVTGELYIGGDGVARGYVGKPGLTALRFIASPYGPAGTRLYRTGDLVRWNFDGQLEFIGRADTQVKIRGFRIEIEEIEHVLRKSGSVIDAAVGADLQTGLERLLAFVVLRPEQSNWHRRSDEGSSRSERPQLAQEPDEHTSMIIKQLKSELRMSLPGYMVPNSIVVLDELPKTRHGKLDRTALAKLSRVTEPALYASPRTELESAICRIWRDLLHVEDVSTSENFFDAGGHSLLLTKMHREIQKLTPASLSLTDLFRYPTISSLADHLTLQERGHRETSSPDLQKLTKGRTRLRAQRATRQLVE
jgi:amino acid adenylation domain-containing protein